MSKKRSIFYKERDWDDFHFYNGSKINEIKIIETPINHDYRSDVSTVFHSTYFNRILPINERLNGLGFVHDKLHNLEFSVLKGFYNYENAYNLFSCFHGKIYLVVVDDREFSTNLNTWESFVLTPHNSLQVLIPPGFSFAFYSFDKNTILFQKLAYAESDEIKKSKYPIFKYNSLNIKWPTPTVIK